MSACTWLRIGALAGLLAACAGGQLGPETCEIEVVQLAEQRTRPDGLDIAYRVRGRAGAAAVVWLSARRASRDYLSGRGVDVGPGPFEAIVELKLTGPAPEYVAVLELSSGKRCRAAP
jgi:hypothetical protein